MRDDTSGSKAALFDNYPNTVYGEAGLNQSHDYDHLREKYQESETSQDFNKYEEQKNSEDKVIQNYNNSYQQGGVEQAGKGVYVRSIEVAPSEILTPEEISSVTQPLVGRNCSIQDLQAVIDRINDMYAAKGFVTARAFLPEQTVDNGNVYIALTESKIGNITVKQNRWTKEGYITRRMPQKEGDLFDIVLFFYSFTALF